MTLSLTEDHAEKLVKYLREHTCLDLPQKWLAEVLRCLKEASQLGPEQFALKLPLSSVTLREEEETTHVYVRRLLNNSRTSHAIPTDGESFSLVAAEALGQALLTAVQAVRDFQARHEPQGREMGTARGA